MKKQKKGIFKPLVIFLSVVLAIVVALNLVTYMSIVKSRSENEKLLITTMEESIAKCDDILNRFSATQEQLDYIAVYKENIENADTTLKKAYITNAMLTYAFTSINTENANRNSDIYNRPAGSMGQSQDYLVTEMNQVLQGFQSAYYKYTVYDEN